MPRSTPRTPNDGRHIDPALGTLTGEAAGMTVRDPDTAWPLARGIRPAIASPDLDAGGADVAGLGDTYYDLPVVKVPPWKWYIPTYFAVGGLAGAAASLAGALELTARDHRLAGRLHGLALLGEATGAALLIADLGRPSRFHHMMRVFRPTSPMNLGTWILSTASATSTLGVLFRGRHRSRSIVGTAISITGVVAGTALSTYTGVLIGNTAVPLWNATRRRLPLWFAALSAASLGSVLELVAPATPLTRLYSAAGKLAQLATAATVVQAAHADGVAAPLARGRSGALWRTATWLGAAGLTATAIGLLRPHRTLGYLAGALGLASAVVSRFAIASAGRASAADPRATFEPQRRRLATP